MKERGAAPNPCCRARHTITALVGRFAAEASKNLFRRIATSPRWFADMLSAEGKKLGTAGNIWELLGIAGKD